MTVSELIRRFTWEMCARGWSKHTRRAYARGLHFFAQWLTSEMQIESVDDVTGEIVAAWREELGRWNVSPATRELRFAAVKSLFRTMKKVRAIDLDPAAAVPFAPQEPRVDERPVLARQEVEMAIGQIDGDSAIALRDRAILEVLIVTGIRNSELRALTIDDVDFEDRTLLVRCGKGRKMRIVPLGRAAAALQRYITEARPKFESAFAAGALFLSRERRPIARKTLERIVQRRLGVAPHRLRHSCATSMIRDGAREEKVQTLLGHTSFETTQMYLH